MNLTEWKTDAHHAWYGRPWSIGEDVAQWLKSAISDHKSIVDIGCGAGRIAKHLMLHYATYHGVEPFDEARDAYRFEAVAIGRKARLWENTGLLLNHFVGCFDVALSFSVLQHIDGEKKLSLIDDIHQLLCKKGRLIVAPELDCDMLGFDHLYSERVYHRSIAKSAVQPFSDFEVWEKI